jgi:hypothetical protein
MKTQIIKKVIRKYEIMLTFNAAKLYFRDRRDLKKFAEKAHLKGYRPASKKGIRKGRKWYNHKEKVITYQDAVSALATRWNIPISLVEVLRKNDGSIRKRFLEVISSHEKENLKISPSFGAEFFTRIVVALARYGMKFTAGKFRRIRCNRMWNYIENFILDYKTLFFDKYGHIITKVHVSDRPHRLFQNSYIKKGKDKMPLVVTRVSFQYLANGKYVNKFRKILKYNKYLICAANHRIDF